MTPPFIIAEIAQGYEGSAKLVELFVKAASYAKADAIKFQIFYADELALPDYEYYQLYRTLELPLEIWEKAIKESHSRGMEFYSDVFGKDSFRDLEKIGVDGYKIHATDISNDNILRIVAEAKKKVFLSTGGCHLDEVDRALDILRGCQVTLMHGFQAEPTKTEDNNLRRIRTLRSKYVNPIGFQDHTAGDSPCASYLSFVAMGLGVDVIEKHLTLSRGAQIEDCISALTPDEFAKWAELTRGISLSLGTEKWELSESELRYRGKVKRAVCSAAEISKGEIFKEDNLTLKRTNNKNAITEISRVVGKRAGRNIPDNTPIEKGDLA